RAGLGRVHAVGEPIDLGEDRALLGRRRVDLAEQRVHHEAAPAPVVPVLAAVWVVPAVPVPVSVVAMVVAMRAAHRHDAENSKCSSEANHVIGPFAGSEWKPRISRPTDTA